MGKSMSLEDTGERMVPEFHKNTLIYAEHYTRYLAAQELAKGKIVLDIASGSGYGTQMLAKKAKHVFGVDVSAEAIEYAAKKFSANNVEYKLGDGVSIPLDDNSVDMVVTFETIEHIPDYAKFMKEVKRVLRPDGLAIVSTPNDVEFAEGNHFHVHEFKHDELVSLLKKEFKNVERYYQATWKYVAITTQEQMEHYDAITMKTLNLAPLKPAEYLYFYMVCSDREITEKIESIGALGDHYSDRTLLGERSATDLHIQNLEAMIVQEKEKLKISEDKLLKITTSRSYQLARKVSQAKGRIKHQD